MEEEIKPDAEPIEELEWEEAETMKVKIEDI
jgi:hypothetical protein